MLFEKKEIWPMYSRVNQTVTLTITEDEYEILLTALGYATAYAQKGDRVLFRHYIELMNSLNKGNPAYTPFEVPK